MRSFTDRGMRRWKKRPSGYIGEFQFQSEEDAAGFILDITLPLARSKSQGKKRAYYAGDSVVYVLLQTQEEAKFVERRLIRRDGWQL